MCMNYYIQNHANITYKMYIKYGIGLYRYKSKCVEL